MTMTEPRDASTGQPRPAVQAAEPYRRGPLIAAHLAALAGGSVLLVAVLNLLEAPTPVANSVAAAWLLLATAAPLIVAWRSPRLSFRTALWSVLAALLLSGATYFALIAVMVAYVNFS